MRLPLIPLAVIVVLIGGGILLFVLSEPPPSHLGAPISASVIDVNGVETEVAIAPDGLRYALIASGDVWFVDLGTGSRTRLTETEEPESAPAWTGDGARITFTRGDDTLGVDPDGGLETLILADARDLVTTTGGETAFVRDRALWVQTADGLRAILPADPNPDVTPRAPRFSPSGGQLLFLKSRLGLHGEVWRVDLATGQTFPVVADRKAENPTSAEWVGDDTRLVYLTDRSGGLAVWYADLESSELVPLTLPLMDRVRGPLGLDVHANRIVFPRHVLASEIRTRTGEVLVGGEGLRMEPALSPDGNRIAYTLARDGVFEIMIEDRRGDGARFLALGRHPRFSPDGNHLVYAATGLDGNRDIWKVDTRTGLQEPLTADAEIDDVPDWSPDGRTIVFSSTLGGPMSLWAIPSSGGQRRRLNDGGYAPRFSPDGDAIAYWWDGALHIADAGGGRATRIAEADRPAVPAWAGSTALIARLDRVVSMEGETETGPIWPEFAVLGDLDWALATIEVESTELGSLELTFTEK
jgi:Tol biopolymer transport system component